MFVHRGLSEEDAFPLKFVRLHSLTPDAIVAECSIEVARWVMIGCVLQHERELVFVTGAVVGAAQGYIQLERGFNGTQPTLHEAGNWEVVIRPHGDFRSAAEKERDRLEAEHAALSWECGSCGGPNFNVDTCRWCGRAK